MSTFLAQVRLTKDVRYFKKEDDRLIWKEDQTIGMNEVVDLLSTSERDGWGQSIFPFRYKGKEFYFLRGEIKDFYQIIG